MPSYRTLLDLDRVAHRIEWTDRDLRRQRRQLRVERISVARCRYAARYPAPTELAHSNA